MQKIWLFTLSLCLFLALNSCRQAPETELRPPLSPGSINLAGLTFYLTHNQLSGMLNMLRCSSSDPIVKRCRWSPSRKDREGLFKGIDEIQFTLYRDSVQTITIYYTQMLDIEYKKFDEAIHQKYAVSKGNLPLDTANVEWSYDSLIVRFTPNKKRHWTTTMFTYTPVLEFQERMLYRRWIDDVEKQTVTALY